MWHNQEKSYANLWESQEKDKKELQKLLEELTTTYKTPERNLDIQDYMFPK